METLTKKVLDKIVQGGCQMAHEHGIKCKAGGPLYLHGKRHMQAPFFLIKDAISEPWWSLQCVIPYCPDRFTFAGRLVCGGKDEVEDGVIYSQNCHPKDGLWAYYVHGSGEVIITCYRCKKEVAKIILEKE